jgi:branched-chain amino acid transport system ATP-binding protein
MIKQVITRNTNYTPTIVEDVSMLLKVDSLRKEFDGVKAVVDLNFQVNDGQIFGIIGPNGSGKTTVFNVITGIYTPTSGCCLFKDMSILGLPAHRITELGMARTFQNLCIFERMSVIENILIGLHSQMAGSTLDGILHSKRWRNAEKESQVKAREYLEFVNLADREKDWARNLSYGEQRRLEIARAIATNPTLLLLDEPTAGMNPQECQEMIHLIRTVHKRGITIIIVEHNMKVMMDLAEWIVAMEAGRKICEGKPEVIQKDERVIRAYLGEEFSL